MKIQFYKKSGEKDAAIEYPKSLESEVSDSRVLEYVRYVRAGIRTANANSKDRSEVAGGGRKPWRQKGTGRARHGSIRSPIWVGGGVTFGPTSDRNYTIKLNKKERKSALLAAIFSKVKEKTVLGITDLRFSEPKTSDAASVLGALPLVGKVVVFASRADKNFAKSFKNIPIATLATADKIDIVKVVSAENLLFTIESLKELENHFSGKNNKEETTRIIDTEKTQKKSISKKNE